jgi:hypothetical protein
MPSARRITCVPSVELTPHGPRASSPFHFSIEVTEEGAKRTILLFADRLLSSMVEP